ncbi:uncharacterized protein TrAFT101_004537 [Trichoderma asperellum]|uniref:uncharacterized protein n=1 Tax=Trichoderma asperellum TaxID=101201 RepID=UPI0033181CAC|nr:hypothetical protein TrAFT101_004537 [Trichoderma asperellum]
MSNATTSEQPFRANVGRSNLTAHAQSADEPPSVWSVCTDGPPRLSPQQAAARRPRTHLKSEDSVLHRSVSKLRALQRTGVRGGAASALATADDDMLMCVTDDSRAHSASWSSSGDELEKMLGLKLL